jgi:hypothetical protein
LKNTETTSNQNVGNTSLSSTNTSSQQRRLECAEEVVGVLLKNWTSFVDLLLQVCGTISQTLNLIFCFISFCFFSITSLNLIDNEIFFVVVVVVVDFQNVDLRQLWNEGYTQIHYYYYHQSFIWRH